MFPRFLEEFYRSIGLKAKFFSDFEERVQFKQVDAIFYGFQ